MSLQKTIDDLIALDHEFGPVPFWFWNKDMDLPEIRRQMEEMKDKGVRQFIIHSRKGIEIEYLSEEWFSKVEYTIRCACELEMSLYIYDEDNWPSGYASNKVIGENEDFCGKHLRQVPRNGRATNLVHSDDEYEYVWEYTLWNPAYSEHNYVDMLNKESTLCFIRNTHEQYYSRFSEYFGNVIRGFFVDEPGFYNNFEMYEKRPDSGTLTWTDKFPEFFRDTKGYSIFDGIRHIFSDLDESSKKYRVDYYEVLTLMYCENFLKTITDWCHEHGVLSIGHLHSEEFLTYHVKSQGDYFRTIGQLDYAGLDRIDLSVDKLTEKYTSSVAHIYGKKRTMSETYANSGWAFNLCDLKKWADWQFVRGVNMIVPHAFFYSIEDDRKYECPPSLFFQNPYWKYFKLYSEYVAKTCRMLSAGRHRCNIAIYYPILTHQSIVTPLSIDSSVELDRRFIEICNRFTDIHADYDFVDFPSIRQGSIVDGKLSIREERYGMLVYACVRQVRYEEVLHMKRALDGGVKVLFIENDGMACIDGDGGPLLEAIRRHAGFHEISGFQANKRYTHAFDEVNLASVLDRANISDVELRNDGVRYLCRQIDDHRLYFLLNESDGEVDATIGIRSEGEKYVYRLDFMKHAVTRVAHRYSEEWIRTDVTFAPWQEAVLIVSGESLDVELEHAVEYQQTCCTTIIDGFEIEIGDGMMKAGLRPLGELGFPCYSGSVLYTREFEVDKQDGPYQIELTGSRDIYELILNDRSVGVKYCAPYAFDVTEHIRDGVNRVKIVFTNTLGNQIDSVDLGSGLEKLVLREMR